MSDETVLIHRITIDMVATGLDGDESLLVKVEPEGDPPLVTALGMLRMAEDTLLHGDDEDSEDDE